MVRPLIIIRKLGGYKDDGLGPVDMGWGGPRRCPRVERKGVGKDARFAGAAAGIAQRAVPPGDDDALPLQAQQIVGVLADLDRDVLPVRCLEDVGDAASAARIARVTPDDGERALELLC